MEFHDTRARTVGTPHDMQEALNPKPLTWDPIYKKATLHTIIKQGNQVLPVPSQKNSSMQPFSYM